MMRDRPLDTATPRRPLATVGALAVSPDERLLLVQTHKWRGRWGVPGGKIDYGETIREALLREFREETGLTLTELRWGPVQEAVESPEFFRADHMILLNFIARASTEEVALNREAQRFAWLTPEAAAALELNTPTRLLLDHYRRVGFGGAPL